MSDAGFVHLHVHSDYSLLDGFGTIDEYVDYTVSHGGDALALTDHNTLTGIYRFITSCKKAGVKPIPGVELNVAPKHPEGARFQGAVQYDVTRPYVLKGAVTHLTLLAYNRTGLLNLFRLVKASNELENRWVEPRVDEGILRRFSEGLICLTGCPNSEVNVRLRLGQFDEAVGEVELLKSIFGGDNVFVELMLLGGYEGYSVARLVDLAKASRTRVVLTNDVHYCVKGDALMQEKILAMGNRQKFSESTVSKGGIRYSFEDDDRFLKSVDELRGLWLRDFQDVGSSVEESVKIFESAVRNTVRIADRVGDFVFDYDPSLRPCVDIPEGFGSSVEYLKFLVAEGFKAKRGGCSKGVREESLRKQAEELEVLVSNDFVDYFLVVYDYVKWTQERGFITGVGRGSAGGSEIAYLLDIHDTDPIRFGLMFDRFLSPGRSALVRVCYDDGSCEVVPVSDVKQVEGVDRYVHELRVGDLVD